MKANVLFFDRKPAAEKPWTDKLWIYDLPPSSDYGATGRTNKHFTLKENPLKRSDLDDFVSLPSGLGAAINFSAMANREQMNLTRND